MSSKFYFRSLKASLSHLVNCCLCPISSPLASIEQTLKTVRKLCHNWQSFVKMSEQLKFNIRRPKTGGLMMSLFSSPSSFLIESWDLLSVKHQATRTSRRKDCTRYHAVSPYKTHNVASEWSYQLVSQTAAINNVFMCACWTMWPDVTGVLRFNLLVGQYQLRSTDQKWPIPDKRLSEIKVRSLLPSWPKLRGAIFDRKTERKLYSILAFCSMFVAEAFLLKIPSHSLACG